MDDPEQHIEALIFASEQGIRIEEIAYCLQFAFNCNYSDQDVIDSISRIQSRYNQNEFALELIAIAKGYQFLTKKKYHPVINLLQLQRSKKKLTQAALETLAIVAYKQPVTKTDLEQIRGVNCDYSLQKLLEKELIAIIGKSDTVGKPILYGTSNLFMDYFGIGDMDQLPQIKDFKNVGSSIGEQSD